jgi:hypothetical protein
LHHVAFAVETDTDVNPAHAVAITAGANILHAPRLWPEYAADY